MTEEIQLEFTFTEQDKKVIRDYAKSIVEVDLDTEEQYEFEFVN